MKIKALLNKATLAAMAAPLFFGTVLSQTVKAEEIWPRSLYSQQHNWVSVSVDGPGTYTIEARTFMNAGDVDIELYDGYREVLIDEANTGGTDRITFTTNRAGTYQLKYKMFACINPFGPCAVAIDLSQW
ncbi:MAG: hypothetical protein AAFR58_25810 [Cyanobacteria bacterium J06627_28]